MLDPATSRLVGDSSTIESPQRPSPRQGWATRLAAPETHFCGGLLLHFSKVIIKHRICEITPSFSSPTASGRRPLLLAAIIEKQKQRQSNRSKNRNTKKNVQELMPPTRFVRHSAT